MQDLLQEWGVGAETLNMLVTYGLRILGVITILLVALAVARWAQRTVQTRLEKANFDATLSRFLAKALRWAILIFAGLGCLGLFGIETTSFAALIGATGLAIGLAFQGSLANVAAGVMLLVFRPYEVGDVIEVAGTRGKVYELGLFTTTLDTPDRRRIVVPNGKVFGDVIESDTHHSTRRVDVNVGVGYDADISHTRQVLVDACGDLDNLVEGEEPQAVLKELGGSSLDWQVRVFCPTEHYWSVKEKLTVAVKEALDDADIDIPYPHVVVQQDGAAAEPAKKAAGYASAKV